MTVRPHSQLPPWWLISHNIINGSLGIGNALIWCCIRDVDYEIQAHHASIQEKIIAIDYERSVSRQPPRLSASMGGTDVSFGAGQSFDYSAIKAQPNHQTTNLAHSMLSVPEEQEKNLVL